MKISTLFSCLLVAIAMWATVLFLVSCGTVTRPDVAPAYSDVNYHSVEMEACGSYMFGVGGCSFPSGASTKTDIGIQGFYTGAISIFSDLCHVDWKQRYGLNEVVKVSLEELLGTPTLQRNQSCTLKIIVNPDPIKNSEEAVSPRIGELFLEVRPTGVTEIVFPIPHDQVRESELDTNVVLKLPVAEDGQFLLSRCAAGNLTDNFSQQIVLPDFSRSFSCKYQLAVKTVTNKKYSGIFFRNVFARNAILLPRPKITRTKDEVCVEADPASTFVSIDSEWVNKPKLCAKGKGPFKVRVWTTRRNYFEIIK